MALEQELETLGASGGDVREAELATTEKRLLQVERKAVQEAAKSGLIDDGVAKELLEEIAVRMHHDEHPPEAASAGAPDPDASEPDASEPDSSEPDSSDLDSPGPDA
ncbi:MAG: hypothetical protein AB8I08_15535 [Sandaracinaceae bacterium]